MRRLPRLAVVVSVCERLRTKGTRPSEEGKSTRMPDVKTLTALAALTALTGATSAVASADASPKPTGPYGLKPGIYVREGTGCGSPPPAAVRRYDGRGIGDAGTRSCRARIISRHGSTFLASQECAGTDPRRQIRSEERMRVEVADALTFKLGRPRSGTTYRYCPAYTLPASLRKYSR